MAETVEGATRVFPLQEGTPRGPGTRDKDAPFYNPAMRLNRDLSVLLVAAFQARRGREVDVADVLAGTGARSLRLAHELKVPLRVHANDADPKAVQAIERGMAANHVTVDRMTVRQGDAHSFLASRRFDVVDIDPYGPPTPFLDAALHATRHDGLLCLTATDTAALCGTYPRVCRRRYGAEHRLHTAPWRAEVGLRILAGTAVRAAGRFDRAATPVLSVFGGHWMRVVLRVGDGRKAADACAKTLGDAWDDGTPHVGRAPPEAPRAGPLWTGPLHDARLLAAMQAVDAPVQDATRRLLDLLVDEADAPAGWVEPGRLRARLGTDAPRRDVLMERLRATGHHATRTHLDPAGIRTDAELDALTSLWQEQP